MKKSLYFAAVLLFVAACTRTREMDIPAGNLTLKAITEGSAHSRTVIDSDTHVFWEPGDAIAVFSGEKSGKFVSSLTSSSASATFSGSLGTDAWPEEMDLWAVYPYSEGAVFDGETVTTVLPSEQVARVGSFGKEMNLAIAHSTTNTLQFYNVGGGIRFSLGEEGITEVVLEGMDGEVLAGKVKVGFQDGLPVVLDVTDGKNSIRMTPSEGESFEKDKWYYLVAIPGSLEKGFKLHFEKADQLGARVFDKAVTIKRSIYGKLTHADEGATYATVSDESIVFKDDLVKSIVVKHFDTSEDGDLSYREAAVVLSFLVDEAETRADDGEGKVSIFAGTGIKSFYELVYFTGLTRIEDGAFAGCTELTSITIPENIVSIGDNAFNGCINLESVTVMSETPPSIGTDAFANTGDCPILVPAGSVEAYVSAWSEYAERIEPTKYPVPEAIDLGLPSGLKWASFNLGASKPEEYGDYFAWGETEPYYSRQNPLTWNEGKEAGYDWSSYKWSMGDYDKLTKYCPAEKTFYWEGSGLPDDKTVLDPDDDAATVNLGGKWRMPTDMEWTELRENCTWTLTTQNGANVWRVTSSNGNSIFFPAAGYRYSTDLDYYSSYGFYWSSSLNTDYPGDAQNVACTTDGVSRSSGSRNSGCSVRPVHGNPAVSVAGISLNKTGLELSIGESCTLSATILPDNATYKSVTWSSSDTSVATVSSSGVVAGASSGSAVITATAVDGGKSATCYVKVLASLEAVDLGLSVKWASLNLGAANANDSGDYYAWGEMEPYYAPGFAWSSSPQWRPGKESGYCWESYRLCDGIENTLTKYNIYPEYGSDGFVDYKTVLELEDDVAHVTLGDKWRMPTKEELSELVEKCTWTWTTGEVNGYVISSPTNGNSIFIPTAGYWAFVYYHKNGNWNYPYGGIWSSSVNTKNPSYAYHLSFGSDYQSLENEYWSSRYYGHNIRPVYGDAPVHISVEQVSLNRSHMEIKTGMSSSTLVATVLPEQATEPGVVWTSSDESVAMISVDGVVLGISEGSTVITATTIDGGKTATCTVVVKDYISLSIPEIVDLGLSVKWASFNLGATASDEYGDYFYSWGETEPKNNYSMATYKWCMGDFYTFTKYCTSSEYGYNGYTDTKTILDPEDDAVHVNLGGNWRMPTDAEWTELREKCTWTSTSQNGVNGMLVTATNGNRIFLPASGHRTGDSLVHVGSSGLYWSSSLDAGYPNCAFYVYFESGSVGRSSSSRSNGWSIRPVWDDGSTP